MKKRYVSLLFFVAAGLVSFTSKAQQISSIQFLRSFSVAQIDSVYTANGIPALVVPITYAVNVYRITYNTVSYDGITPTIATGALLIPQGVPCKMPLISYQHGTTPHRYGVASYIAGELVIGLAEATDGYVIAMPDYLGLGDGPGFHPYTHAASEASASLDMIRASTEAQDSIGFVLNGQLFLVGYSQGGHATMALHRLIETDFANEFTVTASAPMSGPYDVSGVQANVIVNDSVYSQPGYLPYILTAYDMVYGLYDDFSDVVLAPYDTTLPPLLDGLHDMGTLNAAMPSIPNQIMIPAVLDSFANYPDHYFRNALRDNDVYDWRPAAPLKMFYCEADDQVDYRNSLVAYDKFIENGSTSVSKQSAGATYDHFTCAFYALLGGKTWFDSFRNDGIEIFLHTTTQSDHPDGTVIIDSITGGTLPYTFEWTINSVTNQSPPYQWNGTDSTAQNLFGLYPGFYSVIATDANGCTAKDTAFVEHEPGGINSINTIRFNVYPNPFTETTILQFDEAPINATLDIIDLSGKLLRSEVISGKKQVVIERKSMSSGTYFIRITDKEKGVSFAKLVIN